MDVWIFEDGFRRMPAMNKANYYGYVQREILDKNCQFGGTSYAPVLNDIAKYYLEEHPLTGKMTKTGNYLRIEV